MMKIFLNLSSITGKPAFCIFLVFFSLIGAQIIIWSMFREYILFLSGYIRVQNVSIVRIS